MTLSREGPLFILHMHNRDNRISPQFCQSVLRALQIIEDIFFQADDPVDMALVTIGDDKFYSNGLDLEYALAYPTFIDTVLFMFKKLLTFCIPTVAAINGHAFAGGCMFAFAHGNILVIHSR
jgi:enoyl-CoA hydratase/carnithine racemase